MNNFYSLLFSILVTLCINFHTHADQEAAGDLSQKRDVLSARLDSLEMEKQARKRNGKEIADLEYECKKMYDSLALLRTRLSSGERIAEPQGNKEVKPEKNNVLIFIQSLLKPSTIFDWIIVVVGIIALLSALILIIGILLTIVQRSKKRARQSTHPLPRKISFESVPKGSPDVSPSESGKIADIDDRGIEFLRERVQKDIKDIQRFNTDKTPFSTADSPSDQQNVQESRENIRDTVIRASKEGLSVQEISRRYHISIDQVALILRVAHKDNSKNN